MWPSRHSVTSRPSCHGADCLAGSAPQAGPTEEGVEGRESSKKENELHGDPDEVMEEAREVIPSCAGRDVVAATMNLGGRRRLPGSGWVTRRNTQIIACPMSHRLQTSIPR